MAGMSEEQTTREPQLPGWRTGAIPAWLLILGLVVLAAGGLGLASIGNAVGIAAVAVLEAVVVALLYSWVSSTAPRDPAE